MLDINMLYRLIILFVFDKMAVPMTKDTVLQLASVDNDWVPYMDCISTVNNLIDAGFLVESDAIYGTTSYAITADGRLCLSYFFIKIPFSLRDRILTSINNNRSFYKKNQEYFSDYNKNEDSTYTVVLRIESNPNGLELKMKVDDKATAERIYKSWFNKASHVYEALYELLVESGGDGNN